MTFVTSTPGAPSNNISPTISPEGVDKYGFYIDQKPEDPQDHGRNPSPIPGSPSPASGIYNSQVSPRASFRSSTNDSPAFQQTGQISTGASPAHSASSSQRTHRICECRAAEWLHRSLLQKQQSEMKSRKHTTWFAVSDG